jgi:tetratricopeptide (TPR) repeat protein
VSTNRRRSILNFVIVSAILTTIGAILSPLAIAWWQNSGIGKGVQLSASQRSTLTDRVNLAEKLLLEQPDNQVALKAVVNARLQMADIKGTVGSLEKLAMLNPQVPEYMVLVGQSYHYLGDREAAVTSYRRVISSNPQNISALQGLASVLIDGNKPEAAIGLVQSAIKTPIPEGQTAEIGSLKLLLAQIYVSQKRFGDALPVYDELTQANAQDFRPLLAKGLVFKQMGNLTEAQTLLEKAVEIAPAQYKDQIQTLAQSTVPPALSNPLLNGSAVPSVVPSASPSVSATPATSPSASSPAPIELSPSPKPSAK